DFPGDRGGASSVAIQSDGKIVAAGTAFTGNGSQNEDFALARLDTSGLIDNQFGTGGRVTTDFFGQIDGGSGMLIQPDGKIVLAGSAAGNAGNNFALARYLPDSCASSDLSITKTGQPPSVLAGQNVTYSLSVTNNGPDAATNVVLKD